MNLDGMTVAVAYFLGGYELWRAVAVARFVRRGWPRWMAELAFELSDF